MPLSTLPREASETPDSTQRLLSEALRELPRKPIRVLEIGARDLTLAGSLREILGDALAEHCLAHASPLMLAKLRRSASDLDRLRYVPLDPETGLPDAGMFDLIVVPSTAQFPGAETGDRLVRLLDSGGRILARDGVGGDGLVLYAPVSGAPELATSQPFPLTDIQHAYWIGRGSTLSLGGVSCHVYFEWDLEALDPARLEQAWNALILRHGMLRAVVTPEGEQSILASVPHYTVAIDDRSGSSHEDAEAAALATRRRMSAQVFDPEVWPLFELRLTRMPSGRSRLHLDLDLLIVDVQSFHILLLELEQLYERPDSVLPAPGLTFRDYRLALLADQDTAEYRADRDWWLARLDDLPPPPRLPLAQSPDRVVNPSFRRLRRRLAPETWQRLESRAREHGLTTSALLLAAFSEILARWCAEPNFTLNLTQFDRRPLHPDVMKLVGDFTSVLLVDVACEERTDFVTRARAVQTTLWRTLAHSRFSGVEVLRALGRRDNRASDAQMPIVFTSLVGLDIDALVHGNGGGTMLGEPCHLHTETPQVWLDHQAMIRNGSLEYNWIVVDDLFPPGLADAMFAAYGDLLDHLAAADAVWTIPLPDALLPGDQILSRRTVNATETAFSPFRLEAPFLEQVTCRPDALALVSADGSFTYDALRVRVEKLAAVLAFHKPARSEPVAVLLPKGGDQIACVLAVLHQGGAYVPLAHDTPAARLDEIVATAGIRLAFGRRDDRNWPARVTLIDPASVADDTVRAAPVGGRTDDLAYIIYTSGSTGVPKGVAITHAAAANTIADVNRRVSCGPEDRIFGLSALTFDLSVYDIFGALGAGAALVLPAEEERREPAAWLRRIEATGVSIWNSVPALMQMLVEQVEANGETLPEALRWALLSGDWVPLSLPERIARGGKARVAALGGATEAAIWSNWFDVALTRPDWPSVPYGTPLANQRYHILDHALQPRPDWVEGDLYIAGDGLARGYHNDPTRTSEAFFVHSRTGERLYRTGDRARYRPGAMIEFLGRADHQIKLGGYRIEPGEIEAHLSRNDDVSAAVVDVVETNGTRQLVAWVVPGGTGGTCVPLRAILETDAETRWQSALAAASAAGNTVVAADALASLAAFERTGEELALVAMRRALVELGLGKVETIDPDRASGIAPTYRGLLRQWLHILAQHGFYQRDGVTFRQLIVPDPEGVLDRSLDETLLRLRASLDWVDNGHMFADWIESCVRDLPKIMRGSSAEALALLFPGGGAERSEQLYQNNLVAARLGEIAAAAVGTARATETTQIIEVGAGVGGLTASLLPRLAEGQYDYLYTDLSPHFLDIGAAKFAGHPGLRFGLYDIRKPPEEQIRVLNEADVVVAANVLHNAPHAVRALADLRRLLRPGGLLVALEATRNKALQLVTGGLIEGLHTHFEDDRRDTGLPMLNETAWIAALAKAGFRRAAALPGEHHPLAPYGQSVVLAQAPSMIRCVDEAAIVTSLAQSLPDYMIPRRSILIERLPLSSNGKVDRALLPRPCMPVSAGARSGETPHAGLEADLALLWQEVLGCDSVWRDDQFFALGGDSLLATRLANAIRSRIGRDVPLRLLFDHPRLADQAMALGTLDGDGEPTAPVPLASGPGGPLLCFHASDGHAASYRPLSDRLDGHVTVSAIEAPGLRPGETPTADLDLLVDRYRQSLGAPPEGGWQLLGWSMGAHVAWALGHRLLIAGERVARIILVDPTPRSPFAAAVHSPSALLLSCAGRGAQAELIAEGLDDEGLLALPSEKRLVLWRRALAEHRLPASLLADDDQLARFIAVIGANLAAMVASEPTALPEGPEVLVFTAAHRPAEWGPELSEWRHVLPDSAKIVRIDADHWSILGMPELAERIRAAIA